MLDCLENVYEGVEDLHDRFEPPFSLPNHIFLRDHG
jgi:hypothetical protein